MSFFSLLSSTLLFKSFGKTGQFYRKHAKESGIDATALYREKLEALLVYSFKYVPYYRRLLISAGVTSAQDISHDHIYLLPILTKSDITEHSQQLRSSLINKINYVSNTSGGSTGAPVEFLQDSDFNASTRVVKVLMDEAVGHQLGMKKLLLWGSERDIFGGGHEPLSVSLLKRIKNEHWFNSFKITDQKFEECIEWINTNKPEMVLAYVESIYDLSRIINEKSKKIISPKVIMTTAGTLTADVQVEIQRAFPGTLIVNRYGSREVGDIACYHPGYNMLVVNHPSQYVEILDGQGQHVKVGEVGEIVVTNLVNKVMPLIRYKIGDMAKFGGIHEGKILLENITGRVSDVFKNSENESIHGEYFTHLFYEKKWVKKFQVVQKSIDKIVVYIVPIDENIVNSNDLQDMKDKIRLVMGQDCQIDVIIKEHIAPTSSGKYRYTISEIAQ